MATIHEFKPKEIKVTRTVHVKTYEYDGCWWAMIYDRPEPRHFPGGFPRHQNAITFSGNTADRAKQNALDFIRGAAEALKGGES